MIFGTTTMAIVLGIALCVLNAMGFISISWFWATCPFWAGFVLDILIAVFGLIWNLTHYKRDDF